MFRTSQRVFDQKRIIELEHPSYSSDLVPSFIPKEETLKEILIENIDNINDIKSNMTVWKPFYNNSKTSLKDGKVVNGV